MRRVCAGLRRWSTDCGYRPAQGNLLANHGHRLRTFVQIPFLRLPHRSICIDLAATILQIARKKKFRISLSHWFLKEFLFSQNWHSHCTPYLQSLPTQDPRS
jgi:hypothetical protein